MRDWVKADFGIELVELRRVEHGADVAADVWHGVADDGARYAVKWSGGAMSTGLVVASRLAQLGVAGVPAPLPTTEGGLWSEREGRRLSLVPWVSDRGALGGGMTAEHWSSFGTLLARTHAQAQELPRSNSHEQWRAAARELDASDLPLRRAVEALLRRADELAPVVAAQDAPHVVCHGDPHLGNVLLGDDQVWLIDWDDAVLAPREQDLLFVLGGVLPFAPVTERQQAWFFEGYGPVEIDPARLAYYRCTRALEDLIVPARTGDEDAAEIVRGVLSPTGLVTSALRR
ncbi:phosphotransferase enzyme family protein [Allokutzneria oryzae]|uniref:Phosphotransferase enzyme family protein n=1 Tax=Allokutzneria oryzae TaxID=1378989 RepID=A0ABV6A358_9PSEU